MKKQLLTLTSLLVLATSTQAQVTFAPAVNYGTGTQPYSVFSADFNGDGKMDLATANNGSNNVSVLLGSGTGTFATAVNYGTGTNPRSVFSADFNGDGNMDLVTANNGSNNVSVLFGNGTGTFATAVNYGTGTNPRSVFSADFNGDGNMDLATVNNGSNNVSVLLGSGTGTFTAAFNYAVDTQPYSVFSADFNGDGKMDLATANNGSNNISVLLGSGTGTFATAVNYGTGTNPRSVFSADFNGDGNMDLATANNSPSNVSVLLGSGTGTFAAAVNYGVGIAPISVFSADFNGDGNMDLATANYNAINVSVLLGSGIGTFAAAVNYTVGSNPISVFSADFNGDGKMDLATANLVANNMAVLLNTTIFPPGAALNLDGSNDYVSIPYAENATNITHEFWFKTTQGNQGLFSVTDVNPTPGGFDRDLYLTSGNINAYIWLGGPAETITTTGTNYADGNWHHVAHVIGASVGGQRLYVDGVLKASGTASASSFTWNTKILLGYSNTSPSNKYFNGNMDEVRLWNVARTQCEINTYKNCEIPASATGLMANYHFNQGFDAGSNGAVSVASDVSGNSRNGSLTGFALSGATSNWVAPGAVTTGSTTPANLAITVGSTVTNSVICSGNSTTLSGTGANTYVWTGGVMNASAFTPSATASYTVTGTNTLTGCTNTAVSSIKVNTTPTVAASNASVCLGQSLTLSATSSGSNIYWYSSPTSTTVLASSNNYSLIPASSSTVFVQAVNNATVGLLNNLGAGTQQASPNYLIFDALTNFTLTSVEVYPGAIGNVVIDLRDNTGALLTSTTVAVTSTVGPITISVNFAVPTGTGYRLGRGTGSVSLFRNSHPLGSGNTYYPYTLPGVVNITGTNIDTYYYYFFYKWNVFTPNYSCLSNMSPVEVTVNALPTISVNSGAICAGQSFTMAPSGASTYTYSSGSAVVSPTANATYSVSGTNTLTGCVSNVDAESSVTVNALPTISVTSGSVCAGQSFTMVPSGADTYTYSNGSSVATPTANATYSVSGTNTLTGCVSNVDAESSVTVNALPSISVNSGSICAGQSFTMISSGADTYTFSNGSSVTTPTANATYSVSGTNTLTGCSNTAVATVTVNALPTISVNSGTICSGQSFTMIPTGADTYTFSNGSSVATPTANATYSVSGTNTLTGCVSNVDAESSVTVNAIPTISVTSGSICAGQSFTMVPTGAVTYTFSNGSSVATPTANATYTVNGTDANGCVSSVEAISSVTVNALPVLTAVTNNTLLCTGETATLTVSGTATSYTWSTTNNTTAIVVTPSVQTTYTVSGTDGNGCSNNTTVTQNVNACTGIENVASSASANVLIYPNPNNGLFVVELTSASKVTVMNALGQVVIAETFEAGKHTLNINNESTGVYFVKVMTNNKQQIIKVIKE